MSCNEYCRAELKKAWLDSEEGRVEVIKIILRGLRYEHVQSTEQIHGQCERLINGNYRGKDGFIHGVFANYVDKENGCYIKISAAENERAEEIRKKIKAALPNVECRIEDSCSTKN
jgi:hypothetical protein